MLTIKYTTVIPPEDGRRKPKHFGSKEQTLLYLMFNVKLLAYILNEIFLLRTYIWSKI
jgi:hypothetical protein